MKYIDTHAHMNFHIYEQDIHDVITRTLNNDVAVINIGTQQSTSKQTVFLANKHDHLYAIIGLHPIHTTETLHDTQELGNNAQEFTSRAEVFDTDFYKNLAQSSLKVVGIGECGLDYYRINSETKSIQEIAFRKQIELALELDLPLMLHVRPSQDSFDAYYDVLDILREYKKNNQQLRGQTHFFAGTPQIAQEFMTLGFYISFTGVITFAKMYTELVASVPLDMILSETDAPYVTPVPFRGQRNEPIHVREIVKKIAEIKKIDEQKVADTIKENVKKLYGFNY
jgi:TatD DNase family protein